MEIKDLKRNDLVEFSYHFGAGSSVRIEREVVTAIISDATLVIGGTFSFDYDNFQIQKVWRESNLDEYVLIYNRNK